MTSGSKNFLHQPTVLEAAVRVLLGPARRLHDSVEADELVMSVFMAFLALNATREH